MNNPPVYTTKPPSYYVQTGTYVANDLTKVGVPDVPLDDATTAPLGRDDHLRSTGTHEKFRVALLQRLADPTRGYDAVTNPYITVDSQAIDLTVFNGEEDSDGDPEPAGWDRGRMRVPTIPMTTSRLPQGNPEEHFEARERRQDPGSGRCCGIPRVERHSRHSRLPRRPTSTGSTRSITRWAT